MKWFVGARARVVKSKNGVHVGKTCHINRIRFVPKGTPTAGGGTLSIDCDCRIQLDSGEIHNSPFDWLEPILPEGHRPSLLSYEELLNQCKEGTCLMPS